MKRKLSVERSAARWTMAGFASVLLTVQAGNLWAAEQPVPDAAAEAEEAGSGEILVTARRREERLQDVPVAVTAVSGDTLNIQHLDRVADFAAKLPNFSAVQQNTRVSGLYVRGLGGNASNDGAESGVGLIVDNVFFTHVGFSWLDFVDLDHVELVRGPQGTLLGKNTTIGAVIVTTKKPSFKRELNLEAGYANFGRYQIRGNVTGPLIDDVLAFRLTGYRDQSNGWLRNKVDGRKYLDVNRWAVRGQLLLTLPDFTNRLIAEQYETREYNNFYPPYADVTTFANGATRGAAWENKLRSIFGYTPNYNAPDNADYNTQDRITSRVTGVSNQFDWEIGRHTLTSVTAWRKLRFRPSNDSDGSPFSILRAGFDVDVDQYSQELRLASPTDGAFDYQVGAYFLREDLISNNRSIFQSDSTRYFLTGSVPDAFLLPLILDGVEYRQVGKAQITSGALFGQGTWHATDRLALTAGIRYTREKKKASNRGESFGGTPLVGPLAALAPARDAVLAAFGGNVAATATEPGGTFYLSGSETTTGWSWLVNPSYKVSEDVLLYASVSHGEKSGAANLSATPGKPLLIAPEKSTAYEVGVKTSFADKRGTFNINLYWNDITNFQAQQVDPNRFALGSYLGNVGKVRLRGVEAEGVFAIAPGINLSATGAFNDAIYRSYPNGPVPVEYSNVVTSLDWSGKRVVGAAKWSGQVSFDVDQPVSDRLNATFYANQTYRSKTNLLNPFSVYGRQEGYGLTNAGIGLRDADDRWSVVAWGRNLFDKRYYVGVGTATAVNPFIGVLGDPRTYGVTVKGKF
ncbi:MAG: TonB-dependent receptor [Sphingobium sp.]